MLSGIRKVVADVVEEMTASGESVPESLSEKKYSGRFMVCIRYEWLSQYYWNDVVEVQDFATKWMWSYKNDHPNMALGGFTPKST